MKLLYEVLVPGKICGKSRPRFSRKSGAVYTPKQTVYYENYIREMFLMKYSAEQVKCPLHMFIKANMRIPESASKKDRAAYLNGDMPPCKKPDIDNIVKAVLDALNGVAYYDDKQVVSMFAEKEYSDKDGLEIRIFEYIKE